MRPSAVAALALLLITGSVGAKAQPAATPQPAVTTVGANLNISPKRVTFDKARRSATVYIYNQGNSAATFDVALVDRVMLPDGQIMLAADAATRPDIKAAADQLKSAKDVLLVSPRRVTLAPGQGQTVRLRVSSVPDNATGEYRSHLTVTTIPPPSTGLSAEQAAVDPANPNAISFQITSVFGISIPAIVRFTDPDVRAGIENAHIDYVNLPQPSGPPKRTAMLSFDLVRLGSSSLFGNIEIRGRAKGGPALGIARGVGVYTEIPRRNVRIPLERDPSGDKVEITFTDDDTSPGKVLAKLDL
jgi:P pilus assembly chaperone PapD